MPSIFKYDYNNKVFIINLFISFALFGLSILLINHLTVGFVAAMCGAVLTFANSFFLIRMQGIRINHKTNKIIIVNGSFVTKLNIKDVKYVTVNRVPKKIGNKWYGFFCEFFHPYTYMWHCKYVYNQGKVFNICFYMKNGTKEESYFGWLYKEKDKKVVRVEKKLTSFIDKINLLCKNS